jgi:hypothetical protein
MRIFFALASSPHPALRSNIWKANLHDPLVEMGHDVVLWDGGILPLFDVDPRSSACVPLRAEFTQRFLDAVSAAHRERPLELVLTYLTDSHLEPAAIRQVGERVAPIINFFCNAHQFHLVERTSPSYTLCLVPEHSWLADYHRVGALTWFFPMAANPALYHPIDVAPSYDVTFSGQRYADRATAMLALREGGVDAHVFGPGWVEAAGGAAAKAAPGGLAGRLDEARRLLGWTLQGRNPARVVRDRLDWRKLRGRFPQALHPAVSDDDYVALFSRSKIALGFLIVGDTHRLPRPLMQVRLREFEATMSGAFYLTAAFDEIALHYEPGREVVFYRSHEEMVDLARHFLAHDAERERIRRAGRERALRDHTWQRRFETLFAELRGRGLVKAA